MAVIPRHRLSRRSWQALLAVTVVAAVAALPQWRKQSQPPLSKLREPGHYQIKRVVDGDTLVLENVKEHVRLIGANTPETVKPHWPVEPWGPEASAFTKRFVAGGDVRLELDAELHDRYGRILAYVWVGDRMLNEELIRAGLARAELQYRYSAAMKVRFRHAEAEAKAARRGIWSGN